MKKYEKEPKPRPQQRQISELTKEERRQLFETTLNLINNLEGLIRSYETTPITNPELEFWYRDRCIRLFIEIGDMAEVRKSMALGLRNYLEKLRKRYEPLLEYIETHDLIEEEEEENTEEEEEAEDPEDGE